MTGWSWQRWLVAVIGTVLAAVLIGVPTGIIDTSLYTRMTPVLWWNYPIWVVSSILSGLICATFVRAPAAAPTSGAGRLTAGGVLSAFAVGCPICNKLVVAALGVGGALNIWAPIQPLLGVLSVVLLGVALAARVKGERACRIPSAAASAQEQPTARSTSQPAPRSPERRPAGR